jgi:hypothetical protein
LGRKKVPDRALVLGLLAQQVGEGVSNRAAVEGASRI